MERDDFTIDISTSLTDESEPFEDADEAVSKKTPKYEDARRILHLIHLLSVNKCTRLDIIQRLPDYYCINYETAATARSTTINAYQMLRRDLHFLCSLGYEIIRKPDSNNQACYSLEKSWGPFTPFIFGNTELDALALLHTLFADPTEYAHAHLNLPLPLQAPRTSFTENILALIERLESTLPAEQKKYFEQWVRKPYVYFNLQAATDYQPCRAIIDTIVEAISAGVQIRFDYASTHRLQGTTPHEEVDPYYIIFQDGHLYLIGFSHDHTSLYKNRIFEWRIDRIQLESLKRQNNKIDVLRRNHPILFHYWADASIARGGSPSRRWLSQEVEREEITGEGRLRKHRFLIRAQAYDEWRIIQQLHKYGDKVELVDPPELREKMRQEVKRMYNLYFL